jgi:branched-chain amino acid transport system substrate-binding protein
MTGSDLPRIQLTGGTQVRSDTFSHGSPGRLRRRVSFLAATTAALLALAACGSDGGSSSLSGDFDGEINIGLLAALSGQAATRAEASVYGAEAAVNAINKSGGVKVGDKTYGLKLTVRNTQGDVTQATTEATGLVRDDGANILIQHGTSAETTAVAAYAASQSKLLFVGTSTLTPAGETGSEPWDQTFSTVLPAASVFPATINEVKLINPDVKTVALLLEDDPTGETYASLYADAFEAAGLDVVDTQYFPTTGTDFSAQLTAIKAKQPDVLFFGFIPEIDQTILHQADQLDVADLYSSGDSYQIATNAGGIDGQYLAIINGGSYGAETASTKQRKSLGDEITKANGSGDAIDPTWSYYSVGAYATIMDLKKAIESAGTFEDVDAIKDALGDVKVDLASGETFAYDLETHQPKPEGFLLDSVLVDGRNTLKFITVNSDGTKIIAQREEDQ